ncbi:MAG: phosphoribosyltransferase [Promethearchaeota archaeon]|jgi:predicted phosphoribosyltransferase
MKFVKYTSRTEAGELLAEFILQENQQLSDFIFENRDNCFCFAIPNGGVPVSEGFCAHYELNYDILIVRKIKIPDNTEAGFGSVTTDGTILINNQLLLRLNLSDHAVNHSIELTKKEIKERLKLYNKDNELENYYMQNIKNKNVFILDDGLASGFTMLAAIDMIKKYTPAKILIAVPTAPLRTINKIKSGVDEIFCPNVRDVMWFAVADAYQNWYDVPESEVLEIINKSKYYLSSMK